MGQAFTRRLLDAKYSIVGFDVDENKCAEFERLGGEPVDSVAEVAERARRIVLAVLTTSQVEEVVEGKGGLTSIFQTDLEPGIALCTSTCEPERIEALAERAARSGTLLMDAPVSGTSQQVARGEGVGLIGSDSSALKMTEDIVKAIYPRSYFTGGPGTGTKTKLAINLILGLNRVALAEGLVFAERLGLDKANFLDIARSSAAYSQIMDIKGGKMVTADYTPVSRVSQHLKDVWIMLAEAERRGQPLPLTRVLADVLVGCERNGEGDLDNAIMIEEIRRRGAPASADRQQ